MINNANICPFNFEKFTNLNSTTGNIEASLLFSRIKYHQQFSNFRQDGKTWAILTRKQVANWFNFSLDKTDKLLKLLITKGLISKKLILWYGVKKIIITTHKIDSIPVNFNILEDLIKQAGSIKAALIFSHIAFRFANSVIRHKELTWCCINKDTLATWSYYSIKTVYNILKTLEQKNLITKSLFDWNNKTQTHFHIPTDIIKNLQKYWDKKQVPKTTSCKLVEFKISSNI